MLPGEKKKLLSDKDFYGPMGKRFEAFRRLIRLTREQLAAELNVSVNTIEQIEKGKTPPDLCMINCLNKQYGLDINWMIHGHGVVIFTRLMEAHKELRTKKPGKISAKTRETLELWELLKVPSVENTIFTKMEEVKVIYKDRIEAFRRCRQLTNNPVKPQPKRLATEDTEDTEVKKLSSL
jgi:transcriptional regulator with XRE-family HTH domain